MSTTFIAVHNEKIVTKTLDQLKEWVENERGAFFEVWEDQPLIKLCARKANILMQEHIKEFPTESAMFKKFETDQYFHITTFSDEDAAEGLTRYGANSSNVAYQLCRKIFGSDIADASSLKIVNDWDDEFVDLVS